MALKTAELKLWVYEGTENSYTGDPNYEIEKTIISTQSKITFEIAELVRDYINVTFNNYANTYNIGNVPATLKAPCVWATAVTTLYDEDGVPYTYSNPVSNNYIALDGWGDFEDGANPELSRNALISSNKIYLPESTAGKLPLFAEGVGKVIIDSVTTQITDSGNSNQKIQYLTIPANSSTIQVYDTDDATLLKTITIENQCEAKFTPIKFVFLNKFGAFQDVYFFKKTIENISISDESYKRNTVANPTATYDTFEAQKKRYNVNAITQLTVNSGFVSEDINSTMEELFLSEYIWVIWENNTLPVIIKTKDFQYKSSLNDRLINHTVEFEFAFNKINNVR